MRATDGYCSASAIRTAYTALAQRKCVDVGSKWAVSERSDATDIVRAVPTAAPVSLAVRIALCMQSDSDSPCINSRASVNLLR